MGPLEVVVVVVEGVAELEDLPVVEETVEPDDVEERLLVVDCTAVLVLELPDDAVTVTVEAGSVTVVAAAVTVVVDVATRVTVTVGRAIDGQLPLLSRQFRSQYHVSAVASAWNCCTRKGNLYRVHWKLLGLKPKARQAGARRHVSAQSLCNPDDVDVASTRGRRTRPRAAQDEPVGAGSASSTAHIAPVVSTSIAVSTFDACRLTALC